MSYHHKNIAISAKLDLWFNQAYELGNEFKIYLNEQHIFPTHTLSIEQAIGVMKRINEIDGLRMKILRASIYIRNHPDQFKRESIQSNRSIGALFKEIDEKLLEPYEKDAFEAIERYIAYRNNEDKVFAFDGELKATGGPSKDELIQLIGKRETLSLDKRRKARINWKLVIARVIEANHRKDESWVRNINHVQNYYANVDALVQSRVDKYARDGYGNILIQHEHLMKWLTVYEQAITLSEKNIKVLSENLDHIANRKAAMVTMIMRGALSGALSPLLLSGFIDPGVAVLNGILSKIANFKGDISLNLSQTTTIYKMTGFIPDPHKTTYRDAYRQLSEETVYESIDRYKKYLSHKIDTLSATKEFENMMSEKATLWGKYSASDIIRANRMIQIDAAHYNAPNNELIEPEIINNLITAMVEPFKTLIENTYGRISSQYGDTQGNSLMHQIVDKICFDDDKAGLDSHNGSLENAFIKNLSNYIEIIFIVKYLVENSRYFGGSDRDFKLHHTHHKIKDNDTEFGLKADDESIQELVSALIKRIILTDESELKKSLELNPEQSESDQLKNNPLIKKSLWSMSKYHFTNFGADLYLSDKYKPEPEHLKRQAMIKILIHEFYNRDMSELIQEKILSFAEKLGIDTSKKISSIHQDKPVINPKWESENDIKRNIQENIAPFIKQADEHQKMRSIYQHAGQSYLLKNQMITQASHMRAIELTNDNIEKRRKYIKFDIL